jgi:hypothetical protein
MSLSAGIRLICVNGSTQAAPEPEFSSISASGHQMSWQLQSVFGRYHLDPSCSMPVHTQMDLKLSFAFLNASSVTGILPFPVPTKEE